MRVVLTWRAETYTIFAADAWANNVGKIVPITAGGIGGEAWIDAVTQTGDVLTVALDMDYDSDAARAIRGNSGKVAMSPDIQPLSVESWASEYEEAHRRAVRDGEITEPW